MSFSRRERLWRSLQDREYREAFVAENIRNTLAFQVRAMREGRGWTQGELGQKTGMEQGAISRLENPNYGKFTLATLKRLASAFDVGLIVRFVPFGQLIDWNTTMRQKDFAIPCFSEVECEPPDKGEVRDFLASETIQASPLPVLVPSGGVGNITAIAPFGLPMTGQLLTPDLLHCPAQPLH